MALVPYTLEMIKGLLAKIAKDPARIQRILTLSTPDIIASIDDVERIFGDAVRGRLKIRGDSVAIRRWHKSKDISLVVPDTRQFFDLLGYRLDSVDLCEGRGGEIIHNLNKPLPGSFNNGYDLVFDQVSNQCFNFPQVIASVARAVRPGGYAMHVVPITMVNQGYYSISPVTLEEFYAANHFTLRAHRAIHDSHTIKQEWKMPTNRIRGLPDDVLSILVAQKNLDHPGGKPVWPIMNKFLKHPTSSLPKE